MHKGFRNRLAVPVSALAIAFATSAHAQDSDDAQPADAGQSGGTAVAQAATAQAESSIVITGTVVALVVLLLLGAIGFWTLIFAHFSLVAAIFWSTAFVTSIKSPNWARRRFGFSVAEWLVIVAIGMCLMSLCLPVDPCSFGGCRE